MILLFMFNNDIVNDHWGSVMRMAILLLAYLGSFLLFEGSLPVFVNFFI